MTNTIAIWIGALVALLLLADGLANGWQASFFLAKKTVDLIDWVEFWR